MTYPPPMKQACLVCSGDVSVASQVWPRLGLVAPLLGLAGLVRLGPLNPPASELKKLLCSQPCPVSVITQGSGSAALYPGLPRAAL